MVKLIIDIYTSYIYIYIIFDQKYVYNMFQTYFWSN
jgi:hypothetical protein